MALYTDVSRYRMRKAVLERRRSSRQARPVSRISMMRSTIFSITQRRAVHCDTPDPALVTSNPSPGYVGRVLRASSITMAAVCAVILVPCQGDPDGPDEARPALPMDIDGKTERTAVAPSHNSGGPTMRSLTAAATRSFSPISCSDRARMQVTVGIQLLQPVLRATRRNSQLQPRGAGTADRDGVSEHLHVTNWMFYPGLPLELAGRPQ